MVRITSRRHPAVQRCRALAARRRRGDSVLLDGEHLVAEALAAGVALELVIGDRRRLERLGDAAARAGTDVFEGTPDVLDAASPVRASSGIVAVAQWSPVVVAAACEAAGIIVALVDVQDPGNVGAAVRSADALGAGAVIAVGATADPGSWKALRAAMGSTFRLPVAYGSLSEAIAEARRRGARVVATTAADGVPLDRADLDGSILLLVGNEGAGLADEAVSGADAHITIPMRAGVNSLNVATAGALVLWEARRRRRAGTGA